MNSTREKILYTLLTFPGSTINDLAEEVGINGISIRHHLTALEAEDMVTSAEERHGVGRPRLIYTLTDRGIESFPARYMTLTKRLLTTLKGQFGEKELKTLFKNMGRDLAKSLKEKTQGKSAEKSLESQLKHLQKALKEEGYIIELNKEQTAYRLTSFTCPYHRIGLEHPEICALDQSLISEFLSRPMTMESCILESSDRCTYIIPFDH